jgi:Domain of unknown function (DUF1707)
MTERTAEPDHVVSVPGGHLRASDHDRDQVADVLNTAFAEGRLSREEHDERLDQLVRAKTFNDLVDLTRDLVVVGSPAPVAAPQSTSYAIDPSATSSETDRMVAVFSGAERKGRWRVRRRIEAYSIFGGVNLDMREAVFESHVVEIDGIWCFGGLDIKVPEGVEVRNEVMGIFGGSDVKHVGDPQPGAPVLVIKGVALFGGVSVRGPRPSRRRGSTAMVEGFHRSHGCRGRHQH